MLIRKATPDDSAAIAKCLFLAMEEIVFRFIGKNHPAKALEFMLHLVRMENTQYSWQNCIVAEKQGMVIAAINIYDGGKLHELRQPVVDHLKSRYKRDIVPEDETAEGEYYVDTLGVLPQYQGQGAGSALLKYAIEELVIQNGLTMGILVDEGNPAARKLYLNLGFQSSGKKTLMGKKMLHLTIGKTNIIDHKK
jgi:ribosomal protein S18 acetylase RimI-like enzyme